MTQEELEKELDPKIYSMVKKLPFSFDWVDYKGETMFAGFNYEATLKARKPMFDLFYCATEACNHNVLSTVQYDKSKFKKSNLSQSWQENYQKENNGLETVLDFECFEMTMDVLALFAKMLLKMALLSQTLTMLTTYTTVKPITPGNKSH